MGFNFTCLQVAKAALGDEPERKGQELLFHCPVHDDQHPSLSVNGTKDVWMCGPCRAGGTAWELAAFISRFDASNKKEILGWLRALGLLNENGRREFVCAYIYDDKDRNHLFRAERYRLPSPPWKTFIQSRFENGTWIPGLRGIRTVPYRLPDFLEKKMVFIVEGEKDVDALSEWGVPATCNPAGAGKWKKDFNRYFEHKYVAIIPDNDPPGEEHALQIATQLLQVAAGIKIIRLSGLPPKGDFSDWKANGGTKEQLQEIVKSTPNLTPQSLDLWTEEVRRKTPDKSAVPEEELPVESSTSGWKLWDLGNVNEWQAPPLEWIVEPLIPRGGIGFLSGAPKDGKSLVSIDLCIHLAHSLSEGKKWLEKFSCSKSKVLYIAREDPVRRVKERVIEINDSYKYSLPPAAVIQFLIRERFNLMNAEHIDWLSQQVHKNDFDFLILDVLNRMIPDLDELSARDMATMVSVLEQLNRDFGLTILSVDHTRKPQGPRAARDKQEPNPFDLKGSVAKYGAADFMLCISRTEDPGRLQLYCENKDSDERPHFLIDVSPKGSGKPKFTFAGDIDKLSNDMKVLGDTNRQKVLDALGEQSLTTKEVAEKVGLKESTTRNHLKNLFDQGKVERIGKTNSCKWSRRFAEATFSEFGQSNLNYDF